MRIVRLLEFLAIIIFLYFSFLLGKELFFLYLEKKSINISHRNTKIFFEDGNLVLTTDKFYFEKSKIEIRVEKGKFSLDLWESLKDLNLRFEKIYIEKIYIKNEEERKKTKYLPAFTLKAPFYVKELKVQEAKVETPNFILSGRNIFIDQKEFKIEKLEGLASHKKFFLYPLSGKIIDDNLSFSNLRFSFDKYFITGKGKISKDLFFISFNGTVKSGNLNLKIAFEKRNKFASLKGNIKYDSFDNLYYSINGELSKDFEITSGKFTYQKSEASFKGKLNLEDIKISGKLKGKTLKVPFGTFENFTGTFNVEGTFKNPLLKISLRGEELETNVLPLKNFYLKAKVAGKQKDVFLNSKNLSLTLKLEDKNGTGKLSLKSFDIDFLSPVFKERKKFGKWIPKTVLTGECLFKIKELSLESFSGNLSFDSFFFRGFSSIGSLSLRGNSNSVIYKAFLVSPEGVVSSEGELNLKEKFLKAHFEGKNLKVSSIDFLSSVGFKGKVSTRGRVVGKLSNPQATFVFQSEDTSFRGIFIGHIQGEFSVNNKELLISAKGKDVELESLSLYLGSPMGFKLVGKVNNIESKLLMELLKSFGVKTFIDFSGKVTGNFKITSSNILKAKDIKVFSDFSSENVQFSIDKIRGKAREVSGKVVYDQHLKLSLSGNNELLRLENLTLNNGSFNLELNKNTLELFVDGMSLEGLEKSSINGDLKLNIGSKDIESNIALSGELNKKEMNFQAKLNLSLSLKGKLNSFSVFIEGDSKISYPYLKEKIEFDIEGRLHEPENFGSVVFKSKHGDFKLLVFGKKLNLMGSLRNFDLLLPKANVKVKMSFVNLDLRDLSGNIAIPTFEVKPDSFYKLYSVSGLYINLNKGKVSFSNVRFSYLDGWGEVRNIELNGKILKGQIFANLGMKGLLYLTEFKKDVKYIKGRLKLEGKFKYSEGLDYLIKFSSEKVEGKVSYILSRFSVYRFDGKVENGEIREILSEINAGNGNILVKGDDKGLSISLSDVFAGEPGKWRGKISGNLRFENKKLTGKLNITKTKLYFEKKEKDKKDTTKTTLKIPINVSVELNFLEEVEIKGELFRLRVIPKLKLQSRRERLTISGDFYIVDGDINYMGKKFKVVYGSGAINDLFKKDGFVDILATSYIAGYYVYMQIRGSFNSPTLVLSSDPPLTREEILNLVMMGSSPQETEKSSELFPAVQVAYYASSELIKPVEEKVKKILKVDKFSVEPYITKYGETVAKFSIIKKLSKKVRIMGYETTGQNPEYGASVQYFITGRTFLEGKYNSYYGPEFGIGFEINVK
ncbi:MAG: translocation/assembly module TamB domain-containing protein [Desulfurobacteriaceae bacterium]